jgi:hypothetical protein
MVQAPDDQHTGGADLVPERIRKLLYEYAPSLTNRLCVQFGILADRLNGFVNPGNEPVAEVVALALIPIKGLRKIALGRSGKTDVHRATGCDRTRRFTSGQEEFSSLSAVFRRSRMISSLEGSASSSSGPVGSVGFMCLMLSPPAYHWQLTSAACRTLHRRPCVPSRSGRC